MPTFKSYPSPVIFVPKTILICSMVLFGVQIKRLRHLAALLPLPLTVFSVMKKKMLTSLPTPTAAVRRDMSAE